MLSNVAVYPYPAVIGGVRHAGTLVDWPQKCRTCSTLECEKNKTSRIATCSYGFDYVHPAKDTVIAGIAVLDMPAATESKKKMMREHPEILVKKKDLENLVAYIGTAQTDLASAVEDEHKRVFAEEMQRRQYSSEFLASLKESIRKGLSFVHDYKQINTVISQNINVILENAHPSGTIEEKLRAASEEEKAIYWSAKLLEEKLNVARFLLNPEWINKEDDYSKFRFHGLYTKYQRIYQFRFNAKKVTCIPAGESYGEIVANSEAVSVIPHTFIDNALKYSPRNSDVFITFNEIHKGIEFSVSSLGPEIRDDEKENIFSPFFRADAAKKMEDEGSGYGLYLAQFIATNHLKTRITVDQDRRRSRAAYYETTFRILIPWSVRSF